jgi:hypothetical protein
MRPIYSSSPYGGKTVAAPTLAETILWCEYCLLRDKTARVSNSGGECCLLKKKRPWGELCDYWIRDKEEARA